MKNRTILAALVGAAVATFPGAALAATTVVTVNGNDDIFLAGQPDGTVFASDNAPVNSPTLALTQFVTGSPITFSGIGAFSNVGGAPVGGLDGNTALNQVRALSISGVDGGNVNGLIGVFLGDNPASGAFPTSQSGISFSSLSPLLQQAFWIGDGLTGTGTGSLQQFFAPVGATRLFLAPLDLAGSYANNSGSAAVTINFTSSSVVGAVPEPSTWLMMILGFGLVGGTLRSRRRAATGLAAA